MSSTNSSDMLSLSRVFHKSGSYDPYCKVVCAPHFHLHSLVVQRFGSASMVHSLIPKPITSTLHRLPQFRDYLRIAAFHSKTQELLFSFQNQQQLCDQVGEEERNKSWFLIFSSSFFQSCAQLCVCFPWERLWKCAPLHSLRQPVFHPVCSDRTLQPLRTCRAL